MAASDRIVFVPLLGSSPVDDFTTVPHAKVWGIYTDRTQSGATHGIEILAVDNNGLLLGEESVRVGRTLDLFDAEAKHMVDVTDDDPEVPDAVYQAIAVRALNPVRED